MLHYIMVILHASCLVYNLNSLLYCRTVCPIYHFVCILYLSQYCLWRVWMFAMLVAIFHLFTVALFVWFYSLSLYLTQYCLRRFRNTCNILLLGYFCSLATFLRYLYLPSVCSSPVRGIHMCRLFGLPFDPLYCRGSLGLSIILNLCR